MSSDWDALSKRPAPSARARAESVAVSTANRRERPVIERMLQLYLHDFSAYGAAGGGVGAIGADGVFAHAPIDAYWRERGRAAHMIRVEGRLAGFALVNDWSPSDRGVDSAVAEFFVLRQERRRGVGRAAAHALIAAAPGVWEIAALRVNVDAVAFWDRAAPSTPQAWCERLEGDGDRWDGPIWRLTPVT